MRCFHENFSKNLACHTVEITEIYSLGFLGKNFVKATHLLNKSLDTVWKSTLKRDHCDFFPSYQNTKIHEITSLQMNIFIPLGHVSMKY